MGNKGGRPSKWSVEIAMRLAYALAQFKWSDEAARDAGIAPSTFWRWVYLGRRGDPRFAELARLVQRQHEEYNAKYGAAPDGSPLPVADTAWLDALLADLPV